MRVPSMATKACPAFFVAANAVSSFGARVASRPRSRAHTARRSCYPPRTRPPVRECLTFAQVRQHQQGLLPGAALAPA